MKKQYCIEFIGFEVIMAISMEIKFYRNVTPCNFQRVRFFLFPLFESLSLILSLLFYSEDGGSIFFRNVFTYLRNYVASQHKERLSPVSVPFSIQF
jgi:hypothetical protein